MANTRHVTCITKGNGDHYEPHTAISNLGYRNEFGNYYTTRLEMYTFLKNGGSAYVKDKFGNTAYLTTGVSSAGNPYVRTYSDGKLTDNLLALQECVA
ncbi:MAG: hypothetical protein JWM20_994 [Patescibacteria group bacterium]|nr:hypothetical protein [Patescibacteria group bacterium]